MASDWLIPATRAADIAYWHTKEQFALIGFAYIGHMVWIFEGHPSALAVGCRDADLFIVDGGMIPCLANDWATIAAGAMRRRSMSTIGRHTSFPECKLDGYPAAN